MPSFVKHGIFYKMKRKVSTINEQTIKQLVDNFYAKIKRDPDLNPIFSNAIGEDYNEWHSHLEKMYDFWSSIMLGSNRLGVLNAIFMLKIYRWR